MILRQLIIVSVMIAFILLPSLLIAAPEKGSSKEPATKEDIQNLIKLLQETKDSLNKRIDDTKDSLNKRIDDLRETIFWLFGTFIGIALILLGAVIRNLYVLGGKVRAIEQSLETQRDEINFLKGLIEKLVTR